MARRRYYRAIALSLVIHPETCLQLVGQDADAASALWHVEGPPDVVGQGKGHGVLDLRNRESMR